MENIIQQQQRVPIYGWGTGPQGEQIFNTNVPGYNNYFDMNIRDHRQMFGHSWEQDSDDDFDEENGDIYGELDLHRVYGQQLAVWTHKSPDTVALFTPVRGDSFMNIVVFARESLGFDSKVDKISILLPGHSRPVEMDDVFVVSPGSAVIISPRYDYMVTLEIKQLGQKIDLVISLTDTVLELKARLQEERGIPVSQLDLLYRDRPMENARYLFEYRVQHNSTVFALLRLKSEIMIHVKTFWGKEYHLYVDRCNTGLDIVARILRRTVSQNVVDVVKLYELFLPRHSLMLLLGARTLDWNTCLGFYSLENGHVMRLSTIGLAHEMEIQKVPVILENGRYHNILASKFDRWSAVVLKLHGITGYPVNLMKLVRHSDHGIDFSDTVGQIDPNVMSVKLDVTGIRIDDDLLYGVPLKFRFGRGVTELLKVAPSRTIKSVKDTLERVGVPNASSYDLVVDGQRLPNNKRVVDVIEEYKIPIQLQLQQYPVFVHGPHNVIFKMQAHGKETLATFFMRIKMKTGLSFKDYTILMCGKILNEDESKAVFHTDISIRSSLFLIPKKPYLSFFILHQDWLTKLRLPEYPSLKEVKDILWKERKVPEGGLASIGNFLQWYFGARNKNKGVKIGRQKQQLKDKLYVYEERIGDKFMKMKVEPTFDNKIKSRHGKYNNETDADLCELEFLLAKQKGSSHQRAVSQPPNARDSKKYVWTIPADTRMASAMDNARSKKSYIPRRKAYTTIGDEQQHRRLRRRVRQKKEKLAQVEEQELEDEDEEEAHLLFAVEHETGAAVIEPDRKRHKGRGHKSH